MLFSWGPNLAVWLNSKNKITTEKQDKELLKKKKKEKKTPHRPLGNFFFLDTEKENVLFSTQVSMSALLAKSVFNKISHTTKNPGTK